MFVYKHTQIGYFLLIAYSIVILGMGILLFMTDYHPVFMIGLLVMLFVVTLFATLTVSINERTITIRFGLGVIRKRFTLQEIETYRVVRNPWYYGWGVRYTPQGWLYSVSGLLALELQMKTGKTYRIGTDDPQHLAAVLDEVLN